MISYTQFDDSYCLDSSQLLKIAQIFSHTDLLLHGLLFN
jgi:hypothetical protein